MYVRFWHEAPMAVRAPFNDLQLMKVLKEYPHEKVAHAAQAAISRHLWYLSEHLIGLSLFDDRIDTETKKNMVQNFQCPKKQDFSRRIVLSDETPISNVASFVTERTLDIFDVLTLDGKERAQLFLKIDATRSTWPIAYRVYPPPGQRSSSATWFPSSPLGLRL
ncbi:hypothetical protein Hamer_G012427 [Homarus americanus]|uniref:Uncharacterized protein n=1 Tax=Homarus americanus TaxID=6706 RepID=A0A8J5K5B1_HOMAM|nr:hypothetical protein Hamer_G012427 [Homarus americanus]